MLGEKESYWLRRLLLIIALLVTLYLIGLLKSMWLYIFQIAWKVLLPFLIAALIAYLLHPLVTFLQKTHLPRSLSILLVYIVFFGGTGWLFWYYSPVLYVETQRFIGQLPFYFDQIYSMFSHLHYQLDHMPPAIHDGMTMTLEQLEYTVTDSLKKLLNKWRNILDFIILLFLLPFLVFYLLKDVQAMERLIKRLIPRKWQDEGDILGKAVDQALGDYIRGQFMVAGAVGLISLFGLHFFGVPNAVLLGIFIGITDIIPYFGPIIGAVPALMVAASVSMNKWIAVLIMILVIQQLEGNFLSPYVVGRNVHLHPLVIVFALLLGFEVAGFIGLLVSVPLFVVGNNVFHAFKAHREE